MSAPDFVPLRAKGLKAAPGVGRLYPPRQANPAPPQPSGADPAPQKHQNYARGVGLTPRLFEALICAPDSTAMKARGAGYVPSIGKFVQSVDGAYPQVMSEYWCPVVCEDQAGALHVLHVDPISVRQFRRTIAEELQHVQEKRQRMLKRMKQIRQGFPEPSPEFVASRLRRDVTNSEALIDEPLVTQLPRARELHVLIEATPQMVQLGLVCERLLEELPAALCAAGVQHLRLAALPDCEGLGPCELSDLPEEEDAMRCAVAAAAPWLERLVAVDQPPPFPGQQPELRLAKALRRIGTSDVLSGGGAAVLLLACSKPADAEASLGFARRSGMPLLIVGVYGESREDPEEALQELADVGAPGSSLRLYFGREYWTAFVAERRQQLEVAERKVEAAACELKADFDFARDEVVSASILEMRLIERVMRECHEEAEQCEEELRCAGRVLQRALVDRDDIRCVLRGEAQAWEQKQPTADSVERPRTAEQGSAKTAAQMVLRRGAPAPN